MQYKKETNSLAPGTKLKDRFLLSTVLGNGSSGITYMGYDLVLEQNVAIKEYMPSRLCSRGEDKMQVIPIEEHKEAFGKGLKKLWDEAAMIFGSFDVPGICSVRDYFEENGTAYIVQEYLSGMTFKEYLTENKKMDWNTCKKVFQPVMTGLCYLHSKGIVHRDISPDNLMFDGDGQLRIIDFGGAKLAASQNADVVLKEAYAPPEQYLKAGMTGPWSDIFAVCAVMYEALTGEKPHSAISRTRKDTLAPVTTLASVGSNVNDAIMQGLSLDIQKRHFYAGALIKKLGMDTTAADGYLTDVKAVWSSLWIEIVTESSGSFGTKNKFILTRKHKKIIITTVIIIACIVPCVKLYDLAFEAISPEKYYENKVEKARDSLRGTSDYYILDENSNDYDRVLGILKGHENPEINGYYKVTQDMAYDIGLPSNYRSRFNLDKDLALKIAEYYFDCNFSLSYEDSDYSAKMNSDKNNSLILDFTNTTTYESGDGSVDLDIEWDITDKRVQKIDIEADEDKVRIFLKEILPLIVPETYLTDAEIDDIIKQTKGNDDSVNLSDHAKYQLYGYWNNTKDYNIYDHEYRFYIETHGLF